MKINKLKFLSVAVCSLVAALWSEAQCMDPPAEQIDGLPRIQHNATESTNVKSIILEEPGFDDDAINFNENTPVVLINKDMSQFDKNNKIIEEVGTGNITCITSLTETYRYQLESKRFFVKEGDKIIISYKVEIHHGDVIFGLLNTKRTSFYGSLLTLSAGGASHERNFKRIVPKDETETSLVFYVHGNKEKPAHSSFTIENIKIKMM